jgi:CHAD domain-containing protein
MTHLFHESVSKPRQKPAMVRGRQKSGASSLGESLLAAARAILADARGALSAPDLSNAARVHHVRKTFKRWRALLRLLQDSPATSAAELRVEARDLMRELSAARDRQSALDALDDLGNGKALAPATLASMRARLTSSGEAAETITLTSDLRARIADHLDRASHAVDSWRPSELSTAEIGNALGRNYRRARRLVPKRWKTAEPTRLHELRRRVVEHQHQIELIAPLVPRLAKDRGRELQRLRNRPGTCQDLAVLAQLTAPQQPLARWRLRLMPTIESRRETHLRNAARLAETLFAEKPKAFRQRFALKK